MSGSPAFIEVVAAVIRRRDRVLLCQRHDGDHLPLLWEFPGGKVDPGETPERALEREIAEELDVAARIGEEVAVVEHHYPEKSVRIRFHVADIRGEEPRPRVHRELRWIPLDELIDYEVPPANREVVRMLRARAFGETALH